MNMQAAPLLCASAALVLTTLFFAGPNSAAGQAESNDDARASLLDADREMSRIYRDRDAFAEFIAPDVWALPPDAPRAQGRDAFLESSEVFVVMNLEFGPDLAEVSAAGDFGVTIGTFEMDFPGPDGELVRRTGKYQTTWRRDGDGHWKMIADMFNFDAPM